MSQSELPPERAEKAQRLRSVQRQVAGRLIVSGLLFALLVLGAAYLSIVPGRKLRPSAVVTVLESYLEAGRNRSLWGAHSLYSTRGLREVNRQEVFLDLEDRSFFEPQRTVEVTEFEVFPSRAGIDGLSHEAWVVARVVYQSGAIARIDAQLDLEDDGWRIRKIELNRP